MHALPLQNGIAMGHARAGSMLLHPPQFAAVVVGVSQPSAAFRLQSPHPSAQTIPHTRAVHTGVLFGALGQRRPHAPQLSTLVAMLVSQPFGLSESQFSKSVLQSMAQRSIRHAGRAFGAAGHTVSHAWQCIGSFGSVHPASGHTRNVGGQPPSPIRPSGRPTSGPASRND